MSSSIGEQIKVTVFGQSHSAAIGVVIDGLPPGFAVDLEKVQAFLSPARPGRRGLCYRSKRGGCAPGSLGLADGKTCGAPLCAVIENRDTRSKDYPN